MHKWLIFWVVCLLWAQPWLATADTGVPTADETVLRVGFSAFPPWRIARADGRLEGVETDFVRELGRRMKVRVLFVQAPFIRNLKSMESGRIDMMIGVLRRPEREAYMHFIEPPYSTEARYAFFMIKGRQDTLRTYANLQGLHIGVTNGAAYVDKFDTDDSLIKEPVRSLHQNIAKLLRGRIDAFISEESTARYVIMQQGLEHEILTAPYSMGKAQNVFITVSRHSPFVMRTDEISSHISQMRDEGVLGKMYYDYFRHGIP